MRKGSSLPASVWPARGWVPASQVAASLPLLQRLLDIVQFGVEDPGVAQLDQLLGSCVLLEDFGGLHVNELTGLLDDLTVLDPFGTTQLLEGLHLLDALDPVTIVSPRELRLLCGIWSHHGGITAVLPATGEADSDAA